MNKQFAKISEIASKSSRLIVGLMSGTSLDGLDIALCKCAKNEIKVLRFKTIEYDTKLRARISAIQSKELVSLQDITILNTELAQLYAQWVLEALEDWGYSTNEIDLIASHGQTIYHHPSKDQTSTFQIVDGDHIAVKTGIITISDFRQKHTAVGGQGAPLAALMDSRLFQHPVKHRMLLNLGGIANFTWLPSKASNKESVTSDTGPSNTLINEAMLKYFDKAYDNNGEVASSGNVHSELLKYLLLEPFFSKPFPKTTGQEDFNLYLVENLMQSHQIKLSPNDLLATLSKLTTKSIERAFDKVAYGEDYELYISGGGIHNSVLIAELTANLTKATIRDFNELGMSPEAKEAALMAYLANECLEDKYHIVNGKEISLGKISLI